MQIFMFFIGRILPTVGAFFTPKLLQTREIVHSCSNWQNIVMTSDLLFLTEGNKLFGEDNEWQDLMDLCILVVWV